MLVPYHVCMYLFGAVRAWPDTAFHPNPFGSSTTNVTTYDVRVGENGTSFHPKEIHAAVGDTVNFHFYPSNQSIAESTFHNPCHPKTGGVDDSPIFSRFILTTHGVAHQMFSMRINKSDPIWLYNSQTQNRACQAGQAMVINPMDDSGETLALYIEAAKNVKETTSPEKFHGGILMNDTSYLMNGTGPSPAVNKTSTASVIPDGILNDGFWFATALAIVFLVTL